MSTISAVVTVYNEKEIIGECIDSLVRQSRPFDELVLVDNASTDGTCEIIKSYPDVIMAEDINGGIKAIPVVKALLSKNVERCGCRNTGWRLATGDIIAIIEADSDYDGGFVESVLERFEAGADAVEVRRAVHHPDTLIAKVNDDFFEARLLRNSDRYKPVSAWVFRREVIDAIGGYDINMVGYEDTDIGIKLKKGRYKVMYQPKALLYHDGEPRTLAGEIRRSWWFGIRTHKLYTKHPKTFPTTRYAIFWILNLLLLIPPFFLMILAAILTILFIKFILMDMKPLYAMIEAPLALIRFCVFTAAYTVSEIYKKKRAYDLRT